MGQVRIVIAEDHPLTIAGLRLVIGTRSDWLLCAEINDGQQVMAALETHRAEVLVLDLGLPGRTGLDLLLDLKKLPDSPKTIVLSGQEQTLAFKTALDAGADAILTKSEPAELLVDAVQAVLAGRRFISPQLIEQLGPDAGEQGSALSLTSRERDVLRHMSLGLSTKEIGRELEISAATAKKHRENLMRKLSASTAMAAVREAKRLGLVGG